MIKPESWKPIKNYVGYYEVSNYGNVRSLPRKVKWSKFYKSVKGKNLKLNLCKNGYIYVCLAKDKKYKGCRVSRLVAEAFIYNPLNKKTVNHIDGNKLNNNINNLEWNTHSENVLHAYKNELNKYKGGNDIPVIQISKENKTMFFYKSLTKAQKDTGIYAANISNCCKGKRKTAGGYYWRLFKNDN